ncbi:hypothetical protein [Nocardia africana]
MLLRGLVIVALVPVAVFYLAPRVYDLVATPYRLDHTIVSAANYNPALNDVVAHEKVSLAAFVALGKMKTALADVQSTATKVNAELNTLTSQISGDIQAALNRAGANVADLVSSLDTLTGQVNSLQPPVDGATTALSADSSALAAILDDARATAEKVHHARLSAENSADDLSGR